MLLPDLCDYSGGYFVIKGAISVTKPDSDGYDKKLAFKNIAALLVAFQKLITTY